MTNHETNNEVMPRSRGWQGRAVAMRNAERRKAAELAERGWTCFPPDVPAEVRMLLERVAVLARSPHENAPRS